MNNKEEVKRLLIIKEFLDQKVKHFKEKEISTQHMEHLTNEYLFTHYNNESFSFKIRLDKYPKEYLQKIEIKEADKLPILINYLKGELEGLDRTITLEKYVDGYDYIDYSQLKYDDLKVDFDRLTKVGVNKKKGKIKFKN